MHTLLNQSHLMNHLFSIFDYHQNLKHHLQMTVRSLWWKIIEWFDQMHQRNEPWKLVCWIEHFNVNLHPFLNLCFFLDCKQQPSSSQKEVLNNCPIFLCLEVFLWEIIHFKSSIANKSKHATISFCHKLHCFMQLITKSNLTCIDHCSKTRMSLLCRPSVLNNQYEVSHNVQMIIYLLLNDLMKLSSLNQRQ